MSMLLSIVCGESGCSMLPAATVWSTVQHTTPNGVDKSCKLCAFTCLGLGNLEEMTCTDQQPIDTASTAHSHLHVDL